MAGFSFFRASRGRYVGLTSRYRAVVYRDDSTKVRVRISDRIAGASNKGSVFSDSAISIQSGKKKANEFLAGAAR